ncbi:hypothetical protein BJ508DRAFT_335958 [Ascobolus immersus RN42]|uniref:Uncharacterized protein n=1 Tax=Ascobolus immersus RN42 TaxID=1160509 RepID=A0A3N4HPB7_ASCIM|nr:hypothetical protein BJ508DRAFT_335958 [Ascobolus immersus RN42]
MSSPSPTNQQQSTMEVGSNGITIQRPIPKKYTHNAAQRKAFGGGRGSHQYRIRKEKKSKGHLCDGYPVLGEPKGSANRLCFKSEHARIFKKACQEYNAWGAADHPLGSPKDFAARILREIGGCDGQGKYCQKMIAKVKRKIINIGRKMREVKRISKVLRENPTHDEDFIPGVEVLRSTNWVRDRKLNEVLEEYNNTTVDRDAAFTIFAERFFPDENSRNAMETPEYDEQTGEQLPRLLSFLPISEEATAYDVLMDDQVDCYESEVSDSEIQVGLAAVLDDEDDFE